MSRHNSNKCSPQFKRQCRTEYSLNHIYSHSPRWQPLGTPCIQCKETLCGVRRRVSLPREFFHSRTCWQDISKLVRDNNSATLSTEGLEQSTEVHGAYAWSTKWLRQLRSGCHLLCSGFKPWHPGKIHLDLQGISEAESTAYDWLIEGLVQDILRNISCAAKKTEIKNRVWLRGKNVLNQERRGALIAMCTSVIC